MSPKFNKGKFQIFFGEESFDIKSILHRYLGYDPQFEYNQNGKPYIGSNPIYFSKSHSDKMQALIIASFPVGIDIEKIKKRKHIDKIAERYDFKKIPDIHPPIFNRRPPSKGAIYDFYQSWTLREAYIKCIGGRLFDLMPKIKIYEGEDIFLMGINKYTHQGQSFIIDDYCLSLVGDAF